MRAHYVQDGQKYVGMFYEGQYLLDPKYMTKRDLQYYYRYYTAAKGRGQCKRILLVIFCMCFFSYIFVDFNLKHTLMRLKSRFDITAHINGPSESVIDDNDGVYSNTSTLPNYFVDAPGCRIPYLKPSIRDIIQPEQHSKLCDGRKQLISLVQSPLQVRQRSKNSQHRYIRRLSIMLLGVDGLSHLGFHRQLPQTAQYIQAHLNHVEFWGFNKVAEATYENLIPVLLGLDVSELELACVDQTTNKNNVHRQRLDNCPLLWQRYKETGYRTLYAEDTITHSFFYENFDRQPADYYYQVPFTTQSESKSGCSTDQTFTNLLEYVQRLLPKMLKDNFFSYIWFNASRSSQKLDMVMQRLLTHFSNSSLSNNTIIFLMSTHGQQWNILQPTYQAAMEERQPLLFTLFPDWFERLYPTAIRNLRINAHRLTTPFDLHATLLDLLKPSIKLNDKHLILRSVEMNESINNENIPRGISLFLPVPPVRNCENAGIANIYCTCQQTLELQTNDARAQEIARFIVHNINARLSQYPQCRILHLHAIHSAALQQPQRVIAKNLHGEFNSDYLMRIQTKPGLAEFETEVRRFSNGLMRHTTSINRLNLHHRHSYCIDDDKLKMFCYCPR